MQRFHSWTHYPRNSFFYAERKKKIFKNVQFVVFVWHGMGKIKKKFEKFVNIYAKNYFTLDLGREATQSNYSSIILFRTILFTINMHV